MKSMGESLFDAISFWINFMNLVFIVFFFVILIVQARLVFVTVKIDWDWIKKIDYNWKAGKHFVTGVCGQACAAYAYDMHI